MRWVKAVAAIAALLAAGWVSPWLLGLVAGGLAIYATRSTWL